MGSRRFVFLFFPMFFCKCVGHTEFIYTANEEVELYCNTNQWQISTESNNIIDENCTVECDDDHSEEQYRNTIQKFCTKKNSEEVGEKCPLIARKGFFRCVSVLDSGFLFPFKPSPNTLTSYIIAPANKEMTSESEERSSVELTEGGDVLLNCSFNLREGYDNQGFTVYWIKTIKKSSSCVYSYDYEQSEGVMYNHHCSVQEDLLHRLSNQTEGINTHKIRIRNVTESDAGQYLCVLHVHNINKSKGNWKIINNITIRGSEIPGNSRADISKTLIPLFATISILLVVAVMGIIWKKTRTSSRPQAIELQRNQDGDETKEANDMECSPYAVGIGEDEITFKSKRDAEKQEGQETVYSLVKQNDLYEPGP